MPSARPATTERNPPALILYLDTSTLVKLCAKEPGSEKVRNAVTNAGVIAVSEICYVEARSPLARRELEGAFSAQEHNEVVKRLDLGFREVYLSRRLTGETVVRAGDLTREHALRVYDCPSLCRGDRYPRPF